MAVEVVKKSGRLRVMVAQEKDHFVDMDIEAFIATRSGSMMFIQDDDCVEVKKENIKPFINALKHIDECK